jgi:hypothetical protein
MLPALFPAVDQHQHQESTGQCAAQSQRKVPFKPSDQPKATQAAAALNPTLFHAIKTGLLIEKKPDSIGTSAALAQDSGRGQCKLGSKVTTEG